MEDFVYFSPIVFEDETKAEIESQQAYAKVSRDDMCLKRMGSLQAMSAKTRDTAGEGVSNR